MPRARNALCLVLLLGSVAPAAAAPPAPPDLSGRWAMLSVETEVAPVPMVGDVTTEARSLKVLAIEQNGAELTIREQLCGLRFESSAPQVRTSVGPTFARHSPVVVRSAKLVHDPAKKRWTLDVPKAHHVYGAKLKDPIADALPTDSADPRVVDADKDGHPGVTVAINGIVSGEIRLVQRLWSSLRGVVAGADVVTGLIDWGRDQTYLSATNMFLREPLRTRRHTDKTRDYFRLRRAPAGLTCVKLLAGPAQFF